MDPRPDSASCGEQRGDEHGTRAARERSSVFHTFHSVLAGTAHQRGTIAVCTNRRQECLAQFGPGRALIARNAVGDGSVYSQYH